MEKVRGLGKNHTLPPKLRRMKQLDLIRLEDRDPPLICLTERGEACLDWMLRTNGLSGSSE